MMDMKTDYNQLISKTENRIREMFVIPGVCGFDKENPDQTPKYDSFQNFLVDMNKIAEINTDQISSNQAQL